MSAVKAENIPEMNQVPVGFSGFLQKFEEQVPDFRMSFLLWESWSFLTLQNNDVVPLSFYLDGRDAGLERL